VVNDSYGHQIGDKILKQVCSIIKSSIRRTDIAARWGGEELAIYLPGAQVGNGYQIAETIRMRVANETNPKVTVSCGIAEWTRDSEEISVDSLFYYADMALYKAKNNGRNQTQIGLNPEL
jgi:diguanylate cyclase (GGDEF)-like protein